MPWVRWKLFLRLSLSATSLRYMQGYIYCHFAPAANSVLALRSDCTSAAEGCGFLSGFVAYESKGVSLPGSQHQGADYTHESLRSDLITFALTTLQDCAIIFCWEKHVLNFAVAVTVTVVAWRTDSCATLAREKVGWNYRVIIHVNIGHEDLIRTYWLSRHVIFNSLRERERCFSSMFAAPKGFCGEPVLLSISFSQQ